MTPKTKKIAIYLSLATAVAGVGYLLYRRSVNKQNSLLMLEYINSLQKTNTIGAQNQIANEQTDKAIVSTKDANVTEVIAKNKTALVNFDGKWYNLKNKEQLKEAMSKATRIAQDLNFSMTGLGVKKDKFDLAFKRIYTIGAFILVDNVYKALYKETLWKAIDSEEVLYKGAGHGYNAVNVFFGAELPNYDKVISTQSEIWNKLQSKIDSYK